MPDRPARLARLARTIRLTAVLVAALLGGGVYGAITVTPSSGTGASAPPVPSGPGSSSTTGPSVPNGALLVTGIATSVDAGDATGPDLSLPLQITVPVRGRGSATFYNVSVSNQPATVVWQGEEPLDLTGQGAVVPGRVHVTVDGNGSTWHLDGAERELVPGLYTSDAPVAVGRGGLAQPEDTATFTAAEHSVLVTSGDATVQRTSMRLHLTGPGSLVLSGHLTVVNSHKTSRSASSVRLANGPYLIDLVPGPGGVSVSAVIADSAVVTGSGPGSG